MSGGKRWPWFLAVLCFAADRVTKLWAAAALQEGAVALWPGVVGLRYAENTGMAFSLLAGKPWLLGLLSAGAVVGAALLLRRYDLGRLPRVSAMLMLGGALGNMVDRFFTGYVVDMIEVLAFRFAIFNLADVALTVGCALMAGSILLRPGDWRNTNDGHSADDPDPGRRGQQA